MRIGILGSGGVGQDLGLGFIGLGHDVKMGSRNPAKDEIKAWLAKAGEKGLGRDVLRGRRLRRAGRPGDPMDGDGERDPSGWPGKPRRQGGHRRRPIPCFSRSNALPQLAIGGSDSASEQVQRWLPKAKVVKAFNSVNHAHMFKPSFPGGPPDMFICGDDDAARKTVAGICRHFGWGVVDMGKLEAARLIEPLALIYIQNAIRTANWNCAFKLLKK